jgi:hypothetical protein
MNPRWYLWPLLFVLTLTLLVPAPLIQAKGQIQKVVLTGPGINTPIEITDQAFLDSWNSLLGMEDGVSYPQEGKPLSQAPHVEVGYDLVRYMQEPDGQSYVWDRLRYYPNAAGQPGYTFYIGLESGEWVYNRQWFQVTPHGEAMMQQELARFARSSSAPRALPPTGRAVLAQEWLVGLGGMLIGIGGLIQLGLKKRRRRSGGD